MVLFSFAEKKSCIRHEFVAGLIFSLLEYPFQEAMLIKKQIRLHGRSRLLVSSIVEPPVEALLKFVMSLFISCIRTNCDTTRPLILTPPSLNISCPFSVLILLHLLGVMSGDE